MTIEVSGSAAAGSARSRPSRGQGGRAATILEAAAKLFAANGYDGTTLADIAKADGISSAAIYRHYANKEAMLVAMIRGMVTAWESAVVSAAAKAADNPEQALRDLCDASVRVALQYTDVITVWHVESRGQLSVPVRQELAARRSRIVSTWVNRMAAATPGISEHEANQRVRLALMVLNGAARARALPRAVVSEVLYKMMLGFIFAPLSRPGSRSRDVEPLSPALSGTRGSIVSAASFLLAEHGFHSVSMNDIGAEVGIAGPSIYKHFDSKAAILDEVVGLASTRMIETASATLAFEPESSQWLLAFVNQFARWSLDEDPLVTAYMFESNRLEPRAAAAHLKMRKQYNRLWITAARARWPQIDPTAAAVLTLATMEVLFAAPRSEHVEKSTAGVANVLALVWHMLETVGSS